MTKLENQPGTIASLRWQLKQIQSANMLKKPALIEQAVSEAVDLAEKQERRIDDLQNSLLIQTQANSDITDRLKGLETITGIL